MNISSSPQSNDPGFHSPRFLGKQGAVTPVPVITPTMAGMTKDLVI
jgi:hypothetical protein